MTDYLIEWCLFMVNKRKGTDKKKKNRTYNSIKCSWMLTFASFQNQLKITTNFRFLFQQELFISKCHLNVYNTAKTTV